MLGRYLACLGLVLFGLAGCDRHPAGPAAGVQASIAQGEIGSKLPEFQVNSLQGQGLSSADLHGKVVLIDFWATWCQPCKKEMPGYQKLLERYGNKGLVVIGFKFDTMKDTENPTVFARRIGVRYPLAVATEEIRQKFGGIQGLPTTLLYDRQGVLRKKVIGFEYTEAFEKDIQSMF